MGWLSSSGSLDLVRIRCNLAAAMPQVGFEPFVLNAASRSNWRDPQLADIAA